MEETQRDTDAEPSGGEAPEDKPGEPGAEGGSASPNQEKPPGAPADDGTPVGDTDQHSSG